MDQKVAKNSKSPLSLNPNHQITFQMDCRKAENAADQKAVRFQQGEGGAWPSRATQGRKVCDGESNNDGKLPWK